MSTATQKRKTVKATSIKFSPAPEEQPGANVAYGINYVDEQARPIMNSPCTKAVWQQVQTQQLHREFRKEFFVQYNDSGVIEHITIKDKPEFMPGFTKESEQKNDYPAAVLLRRSPDNTVVAERVPERVSMAIVDAICVKVAAMKPEETRSGMLVDGKYVILETRSPIGHDLIFVDPMPR